MAPTALESLLPAGEIFASLPDYGPIEIGTSVSMVCVYGCGWSFIDGFALHSLLGIVTLQTWNVRPACSVCRSRVRTFTVLSRLSRGPNDCADDGESGSLDQIDVLLDAALS